MDNRFGNICTCTRCNGIVHTIRRGDTLYLLSRHYNVTVNDIMNANRNVNIYNLRIGDQICIPVRRMMDARSNEEMHEDMIEEMREEIREEMRENMMNPMSTEGIDNKEYDNNSSIEYMQVKDEAMTTDKKLSELISKDITISELAKLLKEIDK